MTMRFIFSKDTHKVYKNKKTKERFAVSNYEDEILRSGYWMVQSPQKAKWIDTVEYFIKYRFNGNILKASRTLEGIYKKPEYERANLYKLLPMLGGGRKDKKRRKLERMARKIIDEELESEFFKIYHKMKSTRQYTEQMGSAQCEHQLKKIRKKHKDLNPSKNNS